MNLVTSFEYNSKDYTIAEAILYKQQLEEYLNTLLNAFTDRTAQAQLSSYRNLIQATASINEEVLKGMNLVPELYYDEKKINKEKEDLLDFMAHINALIDRSNHLTTIEI